jgi:hypothetical protein
MLFLGLIYFRIKQTAYVNQILSGNDLISLLSFLLSKSAHYNPL